MEVWTMKMNCLTRKFYYGAVAASFALLLALSACTDSDSGSGTNMDEDSKTAGKCVDVPDGAFCDSRNGQVYKTAEIGGQVWTVENMNYYMVGSYCFDDADSNCSKYGRLYDHSTSFHICKDGWHVPSKDEAEKLLKFLSRNRDYLKVFKALSAGIRKKDGTYSLKGEKAYFWISTYLVDHGYCYMEFSSDNETGSLACDGMDQGDALSLRCVKDD